MEFGPVNYSNATPPPKYRCGTCGTYGCKLWREYETCADFSELVCCDCAGKSQKKDVSKINELGKIPESFGNYADGTPAIQWCDQIGWRVPAVPTVEGDTYWGYTSVPDDGVAWWKRLPTRV